MVGKYKQNMLNVINTLEQGDTEEPMVAEAIENTKEVVDFLDAFQVLLNSIETQDNSLAKHPVLLSAFSLITKQVGQVLKAVQTPAAPVLPVAPVAPAGGNRLSSAPAPQGVVGVVAPAPAQKSQEEIQRELDEKLQATQRQSSLTNDLQQQLIQNAAAPVQPPVAVAGQPVPVQGAQALPVAPVAPTAPVAPAGESAQEKLNALLGQKPAGEHQAPADLTEQLRQQMAGATPGVEAPAPAGLTEQLRQQMNNNGQ